jgi:hypothetical protein
MEPGWAHAGRSATTGKALVRAVTQVGEVPRRGAAVLRKAVHGQLTPFPRYKQMTRGNQTRKHDTWSQHRSKPRPDSDLAACAGARVANRARAPLDGSPPHARRAQATRRHPARRRSPWPARSRVALAIPPGNAAQIITDLAEKLAALQRRETLLDEAFLYATSIDNRLCQPGSAGASCIESSHDEMAVRRDARHGRHAGFASLAKLDQRHRRAALAAVVGEGGRGSE